MLSAADVLVAVAGQATAMRQRFHLQGLNRQEGAGHVVLLDVCAGYGAEETLYNSINKQVQPGDATGSLSHVTCTCVSCCLARLLNCMHSSSDWWQVLQQACLTSSEIVKASRWPAPAERMGESQQAWPSCLH